MKNSIIYLLSMLLLLASCSKNEGVEQQDEQAMISMSFNDNTRGEATRALSFESDIKRVRVVMFRKDGASTNYVFRQNEYFGTVALSKVKFDTFSGTYNIHYIINEPLAADGITPLDAYAKIKSVADINALQLAYATPVTSPYRPADVTMFLPESDRVIAGGDNNSYTISVVRTLAKVYVDLVVKESDFPAGEEVQITSVTLKGLPNYSFLVSKVYPLAGTFTDSETQTVAATSAAGVHTYKHVFYVTEYLLAKLDASNATIEITGKLKTSGVECKWSEPLGDKMDGNVAHTKYDIRRNTEYQFIGNVKGYGEYDMVVTCKIEDWAETDIEGGLN